MFSFFSLLSSDESMEMEMETNSVGVRENEFGLEIVNYSSIFVKAKER